jgi:hypothetical protein
MDSAAFQSAGWRQCGTERPFYQSKTHAASGPILTFATQINAAVQLSHCCHSCGAQHFHRRNDGSADFLAVRFPAQSDSHGPLRLLGTMSACCAAFHAIRSSQSEHSQKVLGEPLRVLLPCQKVIQMGNAR